MKKEEALEMLLEVLLEKRDFNGSFLSLQASHSHTEQLQTNAVFSEKWDKQALNVHQDKGWEWQKRWYLDLYGFKDESALATFLSDKPVIYDAGCGLGYTAAWFAKLAPNSLVIGMDYSDAAAIAAKTYAAIPNLFFLQGDIAVPTFRPGSIDYVSCDQVIMHTQDPEQTFAHLAALTKPMGGQFACYFYAKKALPRELLDEHFRTKCAHMTSAELWAMSEQLTELGKRLSELNVTIDSPAIPALGIAAGKYDVQRFIYWNFLKCFWNADLGLENSVSCNFDWYSPSNARRFDKSEIKDLATFNNLREVFFHQEEACFSGRWRHLSA
jgi:SAM-dependent methyltransferase